MRLNNHVFHSQYFQTYLSYDSMMGFSFENAQKVNVDSKSDRFKERAKKPLELLSFKRCVSTAYDRFKILLENIEIPESEAATRSVL